MLVIKKIIKNKQKSKEIYKFMKNIKTYLTIILITLLLALSGYFYYKYTNTSKELDLFSQANKTASTLNLDTLNKLNQLIQEKDSILDVSTKSYYKLEDIRWKEKNSYESKIKILNDFKRAIPIQSPSKTYTLEEIKCDSCCEWLTISKKQLELKNERIEQLNQTTQLFSEYADTTNKQLGNLTEELKRCSDYYNNCLIQSEKKDSIYKLSMVKLYIQKENEKNDIKIKEKRKTFWAKAAAVAVLIVGGILYTTK